MFSSKLASVIISRLKAAEIFMEKNDSRINISPNGRPYPTAGEWFLAYANTQLSPERNVEFTRIIYSYDLVLSRRSRPHPQENLGSVYTEMLTVADNIILSLESREGIKVDWAAEIGDIPDLDISISGQNRFMGMDPLPMERDYTWWLADADHTGNASDKRRIAGFSLQINFGGLALDILNNCL